MKEIKDFHKQYINPGKANLVGLAGFDKHFVRAEGVHVWDDEGNQYLDCLGSYGALNLGHNPPAVLAALDRIRQLPNFLQVSLETMAGVLAHNLAQVLPGELSRSFFCNSGAEAVEGALKLARAATGKTKILHCQGSFHGKTLGALSVTGREKYQKPFAPLVPGCHPIPYGDLQALEDNLRGRDVAAFIVEPIQGENGVIVPPDGYLRGAREICNRYDAIFIFDEIQTGLGRTGYLFACQYEGVVPDVICLAKSLSGSIMPIGAYVATPKVWDRAYGNMEKSLLHTSTFSNNTWAATAGVAALEEIINQRLPERARERGEVFLGRLKTLKDKYPFIKEIRGRGLMIGLEFEKPAKGIMDRLTGGVVNKLSEEYLAAIVAGQLLNQHRIITAYTLNNPNVIRLAPPLVITEEQLNSVADALESIFASSYGVLGMVLAGGKTAISSIFKR